ncbi:exodeoxyribonuclease VII large subunit [Mycoplasmopsis adleri]|uniref:exodeoxyribonuclease VII large subunit n=1 Tax=Mycoplasmopsis adleri TaxID=51362 RepID=UPI003872DD55
MEKYKIPFSNSEREKRSSLIPHYPENILVITSADGAVIKDVQNGWQSTTNATNLYLMDSRVQGQDAVEQIVKKIKEANEYTKVHFDLILLCRGGGSEADLKTFDKEPVIEAIINSKIPVVTAIGHGINISLADLVSCKSFSTPSEAIKNLFEKYVESKPLLNLENYKNRIKNLLSSKQETLKLLQNNLIGKLLVEKFSGLIAKLTQTKENITNKFHSYLTDKSKHLNDWLLRIKQSIKFKTQYLENSIQNTKQKLFDSYKNRIDKFYEKINLLSQTLESYSPYTILKKGYSLAKFNNHLIKSVNQVKTNDILNIDVYDGVIETVVKNKKERGN